ncbi:MAG: hypothetical protein NT030_05845 [Candidatus Saganbacteria bacterium]|nr:hypothetical protein [Candidatus Saganbacteria bacterium]
MKKLAQLLLIVAILLIPQYAQCAKPEYFRSIRIDAWYSIVGEGPIAADGVKNIACYRFAWDSKGMPTKTEYVKDGKSLYDPLYHVAKIDFEYSEGFEKRIFLNAASNKMSNGDGVYTVRFKLNDKGFRNALFNYDSNGQLTEDSHGVVQYAWTLDTFGRKIKSVRLDKAGNKIKDKTGVCEMRSKYDANSNVIEQSNYDKDGKPVDNFWGISIWRWQYDSNGKQTESSFWALGGASTTEPTPVEPQAVGYAISRNKYDRSGNNIETSYYGTDDQLKELASLGYAIVKFKYDGNRNKIEESYFGTDEQPKQDKKLGCAVVRSKYDNSGNLVERSCWNAAGDLVERIDQPYAIERWVYDATDIVTIESYFGADLKPKETAGGYVAKEVKYDSKGNLIEQGYLDVNGALKTLPTDNYAIIRNKYDDNNNVTEISFFDAKDKPIKSNIYACATLRRLFDAMGLITEEAYFDTDQRLMSFRDTGYDMVRFKYDAKGVTTEVSWYGGTLTTVLMKNSKSRKISVLLFGGINTTAGEILSRSDIMIMTKNLNMGLIIFMTLTASGLRGRRCVKMGALGMNLSFDQYQLDKFLIPAK